MQINGRNLSSISAVTFSSQVTPVQPQQIFNKVLAKDITFLNDGTFRLSVPQLGTGTQKTNVKVTVVGEFGLYSPLTLFTYDPAINPSTASSPGGLQNSTSTSTVQPSPTATIQTAANANSNPQSTNAPTMIGTETKVVRNITDTLTVKMSSSTPPAVISTAVIMEVSIFNNTVQNNVTTKKLVRTATSVRTNLVNNNEKLLKLSYVSHKIIQEALLANKTVHITKNMMADEVLPFEIQVKDASSEDPLKMAKEHNLAKVRMLVTPDLSKIAGLTLYGFTILNNDLINAGYAITNENREEKYLQILETGDEKLISKLEDYLNYKDEIETVSHLERKFSKFKNEVLSSSTVEDVTGITNKFLENFYLNY
jgi:hypothetical protein